MVYTMDKVVSGEKEIRFYRTSWLRINMMLVHGEVVAGVDFSG
jgi:hypothetical protein